MNNISSPCPIERLVNRSEEHFIDRRSEGPSDETFEQLAARRADNFDLMIRFLSTLRSKAPDDKARKRIEHAIGGATAAKMALNMAAIGR